MMAICPGVCNFALGFCVFAICPGVCNFALVRIFGTPQTQAFAPKILTNTKATPPLLRWLLRAVALANSANCDYAKANRLRLKRKSYPSPPLLDSALYAQNLVKNKSARSANPRKSFCYFLLLQKVKSSFLYRL